MTFRCGGDEMIKELKGLIFDHKIIFAMCLFVFNLMWKLFVMLFAIGCVRMFNRFQMI